MIDLLIRGGSIVYPWEVIRADIAIAGDKIIGIGSGSDFPQPKRVIDACKKYVLPGVIDVHTHFEAPARGAKGGDDFYTGTVSAAFGGVTTIIDFIIPDYRESILEKLQECIKQASKAVIDYAFHAAFVEATPERLAEVGPIINAGISSLKVFMISVNNGPCCDTASMFALMKEAKKYNALVGVHAEAPSFEKWNTTYGGALGPDPWNDHARIKDNNCEAMAVAEAITCSELTGTPLYIHHVTTKEAVNLIRNARSRGIRVLGETCPHYLLFTQAEYAKSKGYLYLMSPPLRTVDDQNTLWRGLAEGLLQVVTSDHCAYTAEEKKQTLANGVAGIEVMLSLLYSEGIGHRSWKVQDLVRLTSYNPARIFGLYPRKGIIAPGSDADLLIFDPHRQQVLDFRDLHMHIGYSMYDGMETTGKVIMTISHGEVLVEDNTFTGERGRGRFIPGKVLVDPD